jgi:hypothetical protein
MWNYSGPSNKTRVFKEDVDEDELKKVVHRLTSLTASDDIPITCRAKSFNKDHPTPSVSFRALAIVFP